MYNNNLKGVLGSNDLGILDIHNYINLLKHRYILIADTETIGTLDKPIAFDISYIIVDLSKIPYNAINLNHITKRELLKMLKKASVKAICLLNEYVLDNPYNITDMYYRDNIKYYNHCLNRFSNKKYHKYFNKMSDLDMIKTLDRDIKDYHINYMVAFNSSFDFKSITNLYNIVNKTYNTNYSFNLKWIDSRVLPIEHLKSNKEQKQNYRCFCKKFNGKSFFDKDTCTIKTRELITDKNNCKSSVESFYSYYINSRYTEKHMGFYDTIDEAILFIVMIAITLQQFNSTTLYIRYNTSPQGNLYAKNGLLNLDYN